VKLFGHTFFHWIFLCVGMRGVGVRGRTVFNLELRHEGEELRGGDGRGHGCRCSESPLVLCTELGRREKRTLSFSCKSLGEMFVPKLEVCSHFQMSRRASDRELRSAASAV
jgi:hypothetical protein